MNTGQFIKVIFMITKRLLDIFLSILCLIVFCPLFILTTLFILVLDGGPVFFTQERVGRYRKPFKIIKFRTMVKDAEAQLPQLQEYNEATLPFFKIKNDKRITKLGKILRKLSIDELPQLINILKGDMSFVGPRPILPQETQGVPICRFEYRPGLTGPTQIYRNKNLSIMEIEQLEKSYVIHYSLLLDCKILFKTIKVVAKGS